MLSAFANTLKIPELRQRLIFTFGLLAICRVFAAIPVPGINGRALAEFFEKTQEQAGGLFGLYSLFTGGAVENCAIAAMGIMPYISASIILQLLVAVVPQLGRIAREENGRQKIVQYTRYLTVALALFQGYLMVIGYFESPASTFLRGFTGNLVTQAWIDHPFFYRLTAIVALTAGTMLQMWLGEQITARGVGNGISLIITANILARMPAALDRAWTMFFPGEGIESKYNFIHLVAMVAMLLAVIAVIIAITQAQRKIIVQYAKRMVGNRMVAGGQTYMPLRVNYSGVMPIIFAQAILMFPQKIFQLLGDKLPFFAFLGDILNETRGHIAYYTLYSLLIFAFSFFWVATTFNEIQIADDLKKYGGYVPGMRPGKPTADFLRGTMTRITLAGAVFLTVIALIPMWLYNQFGIDYLVASFFGGTSMLIVVGVMLDTMRQVETHLLTRHYDGFLKKGRLRGRR